MKPCRIDFRSYTQKGRIDWAGETNIGECEILMNEIKQSYFQPTAFFPDELMEKFSLPMIEPLIRFLSGTGRRRLSLIDMSKHEIANRSAEQRLMGKVSGCRIKKVLPYVSYSFGFTPFSFFFFPMARLRMSASPSE